MERKSVLVVDDSETIRKQVGGALAHAGYDIVEAVDGLEALDRIDERRFSLVILDVNMPRLNGIELLERLDPKKRGLLVLMLTTEVEPAIIERAKKAGARGWMIKPVNLDQLVRTVEKLIGTPA
ncbi:MAG TPA: response regulator [Polyangiaceae bacterium]|nr:response regulator [Polyangiaceae bacterium]